MGEGQSREAYVNNHLGKCTRNLAPLSGEPRLDGCQLFHPRGKKGLKCAACGCHRSFHLSIDPSVVYNESQRMLLTSNPTSPRQSHLPIPALNSLRELRSSSDKLPQNQKTPLPHAHSRSPALRRPGSDSGVHTDNASVASANAACRPQRLSCDSEDELVPFHKMESRTGWLWARHNTMDEVVDDGVLTQPGSVSAVFGPNASPDKDTVAREREVDKQFTEQRQRMDSMVQDLLKKHQKGKGLQELVNNDAPLEEFSELLLPALRALARPDSKFRSTGLSRASPSPTAASETRSKWEKDGPRVVELHESLMEIIRSLKQFKTMLNIASTLNTSLSLQSALRNIIITISDLLDCERLTLFIVNEKTQTLKVMVSKDTLFKNHINDHFELSIFQGVAGYVARSGTMLNIDDAYSDERFNSEVDKLTGFKTRNILCVPVLEVAKQKVAGVIQAINSSRLPSFTQNECMILQFVGLLAGQTMEHAMLYQEAIKSNAQRGGFLKLISLMNAETGSDSVIDQIIQAAYRLTPCDRVSFFVIEEADDPEKDPWLVCKVSQDNLLVGQQFPLSHGIVGHVATSGVMVNVSKAQTDGRFDGTFDRLSGFTTLNVLTVPIKDSTGKVVAVIQSINKRAALNFDEEDETLISSLAHSAGTILHKAQMYDKLKKAYDSLEYSEQTTKALLKLMKVTEKDLSASDLVDNIIEVTLDILHCDKAALFLVDSGTKALHCVSSDDARGMTMPMGAGLVGASAFSGEPLNVEDAYKDDRFDNTFDKSTGYRTKSILVFPMKDTSGTVVAVLEAVNKKNRQGEDAPFNTHDEDVIEALGRQMSQILRRHMTNMALERLTVDAADIEKWQSMLSIYGRVPKQYHIQQITAGRNASRSVTSVVSRKAGARGSIFKWPSPGATSFDTHAILNLNALQSSEFDVWAQSSERLLEFALLVFRDLGLVTKLKIDVSKLKNFLVATMNAYRKNPYHNWQHGFATMQFVYWTLKKTKVAHFFSDIEVMSLILAAICHDVDHPGNTNYFEIETQTRLALDHNDQSVLENHHAHTTFELLRSPHNNFFKDAIPHRKFMQARCVIIQAILATDMTAHTKVCDRLVELEPGFKSFDASKPADRQFIINLIVHVGDLSSQALPHDAALKWEQKISAEFVAQEKAQEAAGIETPLHMQGLTNQLNRWKAQVGFIDYVLKPLWVGAEAMMPELKAWTKNLYLNRNLYQQKIDALEATEGEEPKPEPG